MASDESEELQVAVCENIDNELMSLGSDVKSTNNFSTESYCEDVDAAMAKVAGAPWLEIIEPTTSQPIRFRYNSENRSCPVPGARSTADHPTYFTIKIHNHIGRCTICATCVSKDYKVHPNKLEGENCDEKGVYLVEHSVDQQNNEFQIKVGIVRMTLKEIEKSLKDRGSIDPFARGNQHGQNRFDMIAVRIAIEVQLWNKENQPFVLRSIASGVVFDKCHQLVIQHASATQGHLDGGLKLYLFFKHIKETDYVEFYHGPSANCTGWSQAVKPIHVHQNSAAYVFTPPYDGPLTDTKIEVKYRLKRKIDKDIVHYSKPWTFYYTSDIEDLLVPPLTPTNESRSKKPLGKSPRTKSSVAGALHFGYKKNYGQSLLPSTATRSPSFKASPPYHNFPRSNPQPSTSTSQPSYTDTADSQHSMSSIPWYHDSPTSFAANQSPISMQYPSLNQGQEIEQLPALLQTDQDWFIPQSMSLFPQPSDEPRIRYHSANGDRLDTPIRPVIKEYSSFGSPMSVEQPVQQSSPPTHNTIPPSIQEEQPDDDNVKKLSDEFYRLKIIKKTSSMKE